MKDNPHPAVSGNGDVIERLRKFYEGILALDPKNCTLATVQLMAHSELTIMEGARLSGLRSAGCVSVPREWLKEVQASVAMFLDDNDVAKDITTAIDGLLASAPSAVGEEGRVPDRECFWLIERKVSPPQYTDTDSSLPGLTSDPRRAFRYKTERQAHEAWRRLVTLRDECKVVEHMFINKTDEPTPAPVPEDVVKLPTPAREIDRGDLIQSLKTLSARHDGWDDFTPVTLADAILSLIGSEVAMSKICEHCEGTGKTWSHAYQGWINRICFWCKGLGHV